MRSDAWFGADRPWWKRVVAHAVASANRLLHAIPPCRWFYRRQFRRGLVWTRLVVPASASGLDGLRAVFLSDVHVGSYLTAADLQELFDRVDELRPDLILLGGDLVHTRAAELRAWRVLIQERSRPGLRWFAVPGNHERFPGIGLSAFHDALSEAGAEVLVNAGRQIEREGQSVLWLGGIDDLAEGDPRPESAIQGRTDGDPVLVLSHHPDCFDELAALLPEGVLVLSGHTHGGQVAPFGRVLLRHSARGYHRGVHRSGASTLYVGRGVGAAILPLRIGAPPEVVVLDWARGVERVEVRDSAVGLANAGSLSR